MNAVQTRVSTYVCPSDPTGSNPLQGGRIQAGADNPAASMGLWYPGSMGPTRNKRARETPASLPGTVPCLATRTRAITAAVRLSAAKSCDTGSSTGPGIRYQVSRRQRRARPYVDDGETIPSQCTYNGINHNFPVAGTTIPLNTFQSTLDGVDTLWWSGCGFKSYHPGGTQFVMVDGSVQLLNDTIDYQLFNNLGTRAGGELAAYRRNEPLSALALTLRGRVLTGRTKRPARWQPRFATLEMARGAPRRLSARLLRVKRQQNWLVQSIPPGGPGFFRWPRCAASYSPVPLAGAAEPYRVALDAKKLVRLFLSVFRVAAPQQGWR